MSSALRALLVAAVAVWVPLRSSAQTQVWAASTLKLSPHRRFDLATSLEQRWRSGQFQHFADLRGTVDASRNWKAFYEFRAPLNANVRPRHTLALEKKFKPEFKDVRIADVTLGLRYHVNRAAPVRYGLYLERKFGKWVPEATAEVWHEQFNPRSPLRRTRYTLGMNYFLTKKWRTTIGYGLQRDYDSGEVLEEAFPMLRLGLRYAP